MSTTAFDALRSYIESTTEASEALQAARAHAAEFGLPAPDESTGQLLSTMANASTSGERAQAVAISPAASVVGLYLLQGLPDNGILTCIDPEAEHQANAKQAFRTAGYPTTRVRFLPARPLDVVGRLANDAYQVIYAEVSALDMLALVKATWPLLAPHGTLVLANSLLDGTLADDTRNDRDTAAAREADEYVRELSDATVTRLPLGGGLTLITKKSA
ncbi:MAG: class I SAM-dependent methyltransferase [Corynebacterium camporealensis]|uniref:O-methyltransferase n=1 Tax=Corynebacterium camporealensis TaxID=161896 RepID=UPI002A9197F1|nr:class I SAM-dependent methyltransferase [Corynebacterium camporealensis]MDY5840575.1 class I SAM-dependent methyltransferase [Corynebacterium camporealensis]